MTALANLPPLAPYPPSKIQSSLKSTDWEAYKALWIQGIELRLRLVDNLFKLLPFSPFSNEFLFLSTYFQNYQQRPSSTSSSVSASVPGSIDAKLNRNVYLLTKRLLLESDMSSITDPSIASSSGIYDLICAACLQFHTVNDWKVTIKHAFERHSKRITVGIENSKSSLIRVASSTGSNSNKSSNVHDLVNDLRTLNTLIRCLPQAGVVLMTGSDYLESLFQLYTLFQTQPQSQQSSNVETGNLQKTLTEHVFYCLRSLMSDSGAQKISMLLDHLYFLKSEVDRISALSASSPQKLQKSKPAPASAPAVGGEGRATLCSSLICTTSFLRHLVKDEAMSENKRAQSVIEFLNSYKTESKHLHPLPQPSTNKKPSTRTHAKGKQKASHRAARTEEMHMHKAAQISQVHDLFPNIPNSHIMRLLDHFNDDVEATVAGLLEPESLPEDLRSTTEQDELGHKGINDQDFDGPQHDLAPRTMLPPPLPTQRKNVFDGDDFDRMKISAGKLHQGRKDIYQQTNQTSDQHAKSKAAILAALSAFDSDDDERDDTYDVADIGGAVDNTVDTDNRPTVKGTADRNEESLYRAWADNQGLFARDSKTRMSPVRQQLKRETGMTDEQIEGWAVMLQRDPKSLSQLEKKYSASRAFGGSQRSLAQTKWQANVSGVESQDENSAAEDEDTAGGLKLSDGHRMGQAQIRGARNWGRGRGRGGDTAGANSDAATQAARRRKEQGHGRGGPSHNRREGRAKKMARGMARPD